MSLKVIRLELARTQQQPAGDPHHAYVLRAPVGPDGRLDAEEFKKVRDLCSVVKTAPGTGDETGRLIHVRNQWVLSYAPGDDDDEPVFRLGSHLFRVGEYVSITEHDGQTRPFRVVSVEDATVVPMYASS
jgi:hypothetical protein